MNLYSIQTTLKENPRPFAVTAVFIFISLGLFFFISWFFGDRPNPLFGNLPTLVVPDVGVNKDNAVIKISPLFAYKESKLGPVYKITKKGFSEAEAHALAKDFELKSTGKKKDGSYDSKLLVWQEKEKSLDINLTLGHVSFKDTAAVSRKTAKKITSRDQATQIAEDYLAQKEVSKEGLTIDSSKTRLLVYGPFVVGETHDEKLANAYELHFTRRLGIYPVLTISSPLESNVIIQIGKNGEISKLTYDHIEIDIQDIASYPLMKRKDLVDLLNKRDFKISRINSYEENFIQNPLQIVFNKVSLGLYFDGRSDYLQPIFVVEGKATRQFNQTSISVFVSAIEEKYFEVSE